VLKWRSFSAIDWMVLVNLICVATESRDLMFVVLLITLFGFGLSFKWIIKNATFEFLPKDFRNTARFLLEMLSLPLLVVLILGTNIYIERFGQFFCA